MVGITGLNSWWWGWQELHSNAQSIEVRYARRFLFGGWLVMPDCFCQTEATTSKIQVSKV
jgi:hypothetical protein